MQKKHWGIEVIFFCLWFCTVALPVFAASLNQDLDRNLNNKDLDGYKVKGWLYQQAKQEFIVYVNDGNKWLSGKAGSSLFSPAVSVVAGTGFIFSDHAIPSPQIYIFKDGSRELFRMDPDNLGEMLKDMQMR
jgi:hypothetical protein